MLYYVCRQPIASVWKKVHSVTTCGLSEASCGVKIAKSFSIRVCYRFNSSKKPWYEVHVLKGSYLVSCTCSEYCLDFYALGAYHTLAIKVFSAHVGSIWVEFGLVSCQFGIKFWLKQDFKDSTCIHVYVVCKAWICVILLHKAWIHTLYDDPWIACSIHGLHSGKGAKLRFAHNMDWPD